MKRIVAYFVAALMLLQCACGYRGRVIEEMQSELAGAQDAAPQIISPSDGAAGQVYSCTASLYFPYSEDTMLGREERTVTYSANERLENALLDELLQGPSEAYPQLNPLFNADTQIINTSLNGNCLFITFNAAFLEPVNELPENWEEDTELSAAVRTQRRMAILAIVNTVTAVDGIYQVQVLVDTQGDGLGRRIKRQDIGLAPTGNNPDELLETISRQYASNASLQTVSNLVFRLMQDKNTERLYTYIADSRTAEKPAYADWIDTFTGVEWTLESYEVLEYVPGYDGTTATVYVNAKFNISLGSTLEHTGTAVTLECESGVWKIDYDSLCRLLPAASPQGG